MENVFPGMWQRWFKNQCVAVGWAPHSGHALHGRTKGKGGWNTARSGIKKMQVGDYVIVALQGNRVGRLGQVTQKAIEDHEWNPLVPIGPGLPAGEMGRRILVRWDLTVGPDSQDLVVRLPKGHTFSSGERRGTISRVQSTSLNSLKYVMNEPENWVDLLGTFRYEKALSDYLANYPNRLEDGLLPYPNSKIREKVFKDRSRLDVLLVDATNCPVIVECKQHAPTIASLKQLRGYMKRLSKEIRCKCRGILVHGGAAKLSAEVLSEARKRPRVEIVNYRMLVEFRVSPQMNG